MALNNLRRSVKWDERRTTDVSSASQPLTSEIRPSPDKRNDSDLAILNDPAAAFCNAVGDIFVRKNLCLCCISVTTRQYTTRKLHCTVGPAAAAATLSNYGVSCIGRKRERMMHLRWYLMPPFAWEMMINSSFPLVLEFDWAPARFLPSA